jgi:hypothetical protein
MTPAVYERERRSSRVFMRLRVAVAGKNRDGRKFRQNTETIVINSHGGLLWIAQPLKMGALLAITNAASHEEEECRVVYLGEEGDKGQRVGVEFLTPAPRFWGMEFTQPVSQEPSPVAP